jgi:asparagine N-glycosylation enzyme membrane subunit Stt3
MNVRIVAAAAVLVSAYVHLYEWLNGFRHDNVMGPLFAVNVVAGVVIAVLLFTWKHWLVPFLAFGFGASTLGGFAIATTSGGLFGTHEKWQGGYVRAAAISEAVAIDGGIICLLREYRSTPARQQSTVAG